MPFKELGQIEAKELIPGYHGRFLHMETMTMAWWEIKAGSPFPEHHHPHEQISKIIEGTFELTIDGVTQTLHAGNVALIPSNAVHSGRALTDCKVLDIFSPVREEYQ